MIQNIFFSVSMFVLVKNDPLHCLNFHENPQKKFVAVLKDPNLNSNNSIKKSKRTIVIPIKNRNSVVLKDSYFGPDDERNKEYSILGYFKNLGSYFVQVNLYERSEFVLVTNEGQLFKVWGMPHLSPDGHTIACFSQGIEYAVYDNGVQIIDMQEKKLVERCRFTTKDYEPVGLKWTGLDEITIKANFYDHNFNVKRTTYLSSKLAGHR